MPPKRAKKAAAPASVTFSFAGALIAFSGSFPGKTQAAVKAIAEAAGAVVSPNVVYDTSILVTTEADCKKKTAKVRAAKSLGIPIVSLEWLEQCVQKGTRLAEKDYLLYSPAPDEEEEEEEEAKEEEKEDDDIKATPSNSNSQSTPTGRATRKRPAPAPAASDEDVASQPKRTRGGKAKVAPVPPVDDDGDLKMKEEEDEAKDTKNPKSKKKEDSPEPVMGGGQILKRSDILIPLDEGCPHRSHTVYVDAKGVIYDASLNQTNASYNNNKFYRLQVSDKQLWPRSLLTPV